MKQITSPRYIYKIDAERLARNNWNLKTSNNASKQLNDIIALSDSQAFRFITEIAELKTDFKSKDEEKEYCKEAYKDYVVAVNFKNMDKDSSIEEINDNTYKKLFNRACKGFYINGNKFKRFVGTTGGVKGNTVLFVNEKIYKELSKRSENGRDKKKEIVPSKFEAYKALMFSTSIEVTQPVKVAVVKDVINTFNDDVIYLNDMDSENNKLDKPTIEEKNMLCEIIPSDGCGLCKPSLIKKWSMDINSNKVIDGEIDEKYIFGGVCLRNAFLKGMVYPFEYDKWIDEFNNGNGKCLDVWGNEIDLKECDLILTEGMLKLWDSYKSIEHYLNECKKSGFKFAVCKTVEDEIDDKRRLNYQYLQSFEMTDEDIKELCSETIDWLKDSLCGEYKSTLKFLGVKENQDINSMKEFGFKEALSLNRELLNDKFIIQRINKMIRVKIDEAKIGKLIVDGNYQMSGCDPVLIIQNCLGLKTDGYLKAGEFYSTYWDNKGSDEILLMRSPMTVHNNIIKGKILKDKDKTKWYKYMKNVMIFNGHDNTMACENGQDHDGDSNFSTDNKVLLRCHKKTKPIICSQGKAKKEKITEALLRKSNLHGFNNSVGQITNRATSMYDKIVSFEKDSEEYIEMSNRIMLSQLYQQSMIDSVKGCPVTKMNRMWYDRKSCEPILEDIFDENTGELKKRRDTQEEIEEKIFNSKLVVDKKPYFFIYVYPTVKDKYKTYIEEMDDYCQMKFKVRVEALINFDNKTDKQEKFLKEYYDNIPVSTTKSTMNRICNYIENEFRGYTSKLCKERIFDYSIMKSNVDYTDEEYESVKKIYEEFSSYSSQQIKENFAIITDKGKRKSSREVFVDTYKSNLDKLNLGEEKLCDIALDICYSNDKSKQFIWDMCGEQIIKNLYKGECK